MLKKIFLFCVCYVFSAWSIAADIQVYFSPNGGCQQAVVAQIRQATQTLDIAMYYLSSREIAQALVQAQERGVHVRLVLDQGQEIESASKATYLIKHGFDIRYHMGFGLMHNKFALIDGHALITGSFNWTRTAEERNEENLLIITDAVVIQKYQERFNYLWNTSREDARNAKGLAVIPSWWCTNFHLWCAVS